VRSSSSTETVGSDLEVQIAAEFSLPVFAWTIAADTMWWSDSMFGLHGYEPSEVEPSLSVLVEHQHPQDRERAERAFERIKRDARPFVFEHRLVTRQSHLRTVILTVNATTGPTGRPDVVTGTCLDVSDARRIHHAAAEETMSGLQAEISRLTAQIDSRDVINQAAGVLIERHKIPAPEAAALLRKGSQLAGRKLYDVASELLFSGRLPPGATPSPHIPKPGPR
jgi:hypothetical protein